MFGFSRGLQRLIRLKYERDPKRGTRGQVRRVSPDLARHGSGCPVLGTLVPFGIPLGAMSACPNSCFTATTAALSKLWRCLGDCQNQTQVRSLCA
jgi:hypothetical protein